MKSFQSYLLSLILTTLIAGLVTGHSIAQNNIPVTPGSFFGFEPGSDGNLFDYEQMISYYKKLDESSPRVEMREIGKSPMGKPMFIVFISSEQNIRNLDELGKINKKLALEADLNNGQVKDLISKGKVFFMATLSMHSDEVGPSQSSPLIAYDLATTRDAAKLKWINDVVYMMVPNINPDGMDIIVKHYRQYKGTKYQDSKLPGIYNKYTDHDNNRDFVTLSQSDSKAVSEITSKTWFPQVMVDKHQMGYYSARYVIPPNHDPIAENIDEGLWNWTGLFGSNMMKDLGREGCSGVAQRYEFDNYWPGSTKTCMWKNVSAMLTEAASCNLASPVFIEPEELSVSGKGLAEYKKSTNMTLPWPGGWWHLSDIIKMEIVSTNSLLSSCSSNREEILKFRNDICKKEVAKGKSEAPYYYIMPVEQHDRSEWTDLSRLLTEHGINVYKLQKRVVINSKIYEPGAFVVPLSQPFRPFIKEVMEVQEYPVRHYSAGGELIKPYDITTWSLPLHKGVNCDEIRILSEELEKNLQAWTPEKEALQSVNSASSVILNVNSNCSYKAAFMATAAGLKVQRLTEDGTIDNNTFKKGSFLISTDGNGGSKTLEQILNSVNNSPVIVNDAGLLKLEGFTVPKIAIAESWNGDMDSGWTRFVLDSYAIPFKVLHPEDFEKTNLENQFDVLIFPDMEADILMKGKINYPPGYTKGIGEKGFENVLKFLANGGKIVSWGESTGLFIGPLKIKYAEDNTDEFALPVQDISKSLIAKGLYCPGSLVNIKLRTGHPLTLGMEDEIGVYYRGKTAFMTSEPYLDTDRRIIASFPEKEILKSGYLEKGELLGRKAAMVWLRKGKGQLVLFAFGPQFRASVPVSYKLLFNALLLPPIE